ncbi:MAG TPA: PhzF family phenazine biosynthesis isomerase [Chryseosolibacter sp.]
MKTFIVDSFTSEPFRGNPAGVCFPASPPGEVLMQQIAKELGLSETAFVQQTLRPDTFRIRYFSPRKEIPLCGHATLASAKVIFETTDETTLHFVTIENLDLLVTKEADEIVMEFPVYDTTPATAPAAMLEALGVSSVRNTAFSAKNKIMLLEIEDADALARLKPDFAALVHSHQGINGVLVTAPSGTGAYDYHYRYFWPWAGTDEDPVTGGVQTFLAKYWSERLGKKVMRAFQSSARTGYMNIELRGETVLLKSQAIIVLEGNLRQFEAASSEIR